MLWLSPCVYLSASWYILPLSLGQKWRSEIAKNPGGSSQTATDFRSSLVTWWLCILTISMECLKRILRKYAGWVVWIFVISLRMYCSASCLFLNCKIFGYSLSPSKILTSLAETMCAVQCISWIGSSWLIAEERNCIFGMLMSFTLFTRTQFWASCPSFWKSNAQVYNDRQP